MKNEDNLNRLLKAETINANVKAAAFYTIEQYIEHKRKGFKINLTPEGVVKVNEYLESMED